MTFFLNRNTYTGRDTMNQLGKIAPNIIKNASSEIKNIAEQRINQAISQRGKELERVVPNILRRAIEVAKYSQRSYRRRVPDTLSPSRKIRQTTVAKIKKQATTSNTLKILICIYS